MTIQELIDKLNSYPDYFKSAQVFVECAEEAEQYDITDIFDDMHHAIYLEVEKR